MIKRKIFLIIPLVIIDIFLIIFLGSCGKKEEKNVVKIGVSIANFEYKFLSNIKLGMEEYENTLENKVEVSYLDARGDLEKQEEQVKYFIEEGMDAIIVVPSETEYTANMTEFAIKSKIPIIYVNSFPEEFRKKDMPEGVYYVGSNEKEAGIIQMEYLVEKLAGKGNVAILMGDLSYNAAFDRTEGNEEIADLYPDIKIVDKKSAKWLSPLAASVVEDWIVSNKNIDAIVANNDEMAIGAIRALEKYDKIDKILVFGIDATAEAISELEAGRLAGSVFQDSYLQGKISLDVALQVSKEKTIQNITWIPFQLVTRDNYRKIIVK